MNSILLMILLGVNWHQEMKTLFQYYTFDIKISNNIFFGPILMELRYLFMNDNSTRLTIFQHSLVSLKNAITTTHLRIYIT